MELPGVDVRTSRDGDSAAEEFSAVVEEIVGPRTFRVRHVAEHRSHVAHLADQTWLGDATDLMVGEEVFVGGIASDGGIVVTTLRRTGQIIEGRVLRRDGDIIWTRSGEVRIGGATTPRPFVSRDTGRRYEASPPSEIREHDDVIVLTRLDPELDCRVAVAMGVASERDRPGESEAG